MDFLTRIIVTLLGVSLVYGIAPASQFDQVWSGHLRANGLLDNYSDDHILALSSGDQHFINGGLDGRLNLSLYWGERASLNFGYEVVLTGGETRKTLSDLARSGDLIDTLLFNRGAPTDDNQLFSLTSIISETDEYIFYHRLDRLFFAYDSAVGNFGVGRQALTWGNGLLFNPADLVNPFAPNDIIRDYKIGSDMILYQNGFDILSDLQLVAVPRTDEQDELSTDQSTLGIKMRFSGEPGDFDLYVMKNYEDPVLGAGGSTYLGGGVLRSDVTWTYFGEEGDPDSFVSAVVNYDYSWVWSAKNWYGFIEFYYNGLGDSDLFSALQNEALQERLARGEIFVTGNYYLDAMVQFEAHPLVNIFTTLIYNLEDNSFLLQPRVNWDISQATQLLGGLNIPVGGDNTEFGDVRSPEGDAGLGSPLQLYLILTLFF